MWVLQAFNVYSARVCGIVIGGLLLVNLGVVFWGVLCRFVLDIPQQWADEVAVYLMVWAVFLGCSIGLHRNLHIKMTAIEDRIPGAYLRWVRLVFHLLIMVFLILTVVAGWRMVYALRGAYSPSLRVVSMYWVYSAIPVGCALMFLQALGLFLQEFQLGGSRTPAEPRT